AGLAVGAVVLTLGRTDSGTRAVLLGVASAAVLNGVMICLVTLAAPADVGMLQQYLLGSLAGRSWPQVPVVGWTVLIALPAAGWLLPRLRVLRLGDDVATGLGIHVGRTRLVALMASSLLVAGVVAVVGPVWFVALLAPHVVRRAAGSLDPMVVAPLAALVGAAIVIAVDGMGRLLVHPREIAVGIWTSLLGVPVLLAMLRAGTSRRTAS
ncbi:MAG: iron chelate uptake ABC transporter family permease subunit, partial [Actinomycetaceae bacterium]